MDFCFALIRFGTCEAHWSPELYWKIPLQAANSIRIDKTLFLSSYLPGLGATGPAGNGGGGWDVLLCTPGGGDGMEPWEETSHDRPLYLSPAEIAGASSLMSSQCGVRGISPHKLCSRSPIPKQLLSLKLTFSNSSAWRQFIQFYQVSYRRPVGNLSRQSFIRCLHPQPQKPSTLRFKSFIWLFYMCERFVCR